MALGPSPLPGVDTGTTTMVLVGVCPTCWEPDASTVMVLLPCPAPVADVRRLWPAPLTGAGIMAEWLMTEAVAEAMEIDMGVTGAAEPVLGVGSLMPELSPLSAPPCIIMPPSSMNCNQNTCRSTKAINAGN